jgi:hypothetical protein
MVHFYHLIEEKQLPFQQSTPAFFRPQNIRKVPVKKWGLF